FIPEEFMGSYVQPASGVTDENGWVALKMEGDEEAGSHFGFFKAEITLPGESEAKTGFGSEVSYDAPGISGGEIVFDVRDK
ncbi:MAG: hypothetical protein N2C14_28545, partial [Planctomycetales bacterium]